MIYKRFRLVCAVRVLLLSATIAALFYLTLHTNLLATIVIVAAIALYQVFALMHYVEKTNRDLTRFLQSIQHADFSQSFTGSGLGTSFDDLKAAFTRVTDEFRRARAEKEEHFRYLQTVVQHVGIGLLAFKYDGAVDLINNAAKRLLKVPYLKNIAGLEPISPVLVSVLRQLRAGEKALVKIDDAEGVVQLAVYATEFKMRDETFTLVSLQNIQSELEEKEMEAWQNLIRVLTHEIMNSVTPISSLASSVKDLLRAREDQNGDLAVDSETLGDVRSAVQTIQKRSEGLLHFVDSYRNLTRIPKPKFQVFPVKNLFKQVQQLMSASVRNNGIAFHARIEPVSLELTADPELIEQVLINLLLNAMQAVHEQRNARIDLNAQLDERGRVVIQVKDNGPGIIAEAREKIFIPFFTTKKGGSGIGLSLSRQIMRLHRGTIGVSSEPNVATVFTLRF